MCKDFLFIVHLTAFRFRRLKVLNSVFSKRDKTVRRFGIHSFKNGVTLDSLVTTKLNIR